MDKLRTDMQKATVSSTPEGAVQPTAGAGPSDMSAGTTEGEKAEAQAEEGEEDFDYQVEDDDIEESDTDDDDR